jgi:hypothetical protein
MNTESTGWLLLAGELIRSMLAMGAEVIPPLPQPVEGDLR